MGVSEMAPEGRQRPLLCPPYPHPDALGAWWLNRSPVSPGQQLGIEGLGAALVLNPLAGWRWVVVGEMLPSEGPVPVCFTRLGRQRAVLPRFHLGMLCSGLALVIASVLPGEETQ